MTNEVFSCWAWQTRVSRFTSWNNSPLVTLLCLINNRALANHFNEVYSTERCVWSVMLQTISCKMGELMRHPQFSVFCLGEIFYASQSQLSEQMRVQQTKLLFAQINEKSCRCSHVNMQKWRIFMHESVRVQTGATENLSLSMLILARRQTLGLRKEPNIIILEKWSKVSFLQFFRPKQCYLSH